MKKKRKMEPVQKMYIHIHIHTYAHTHIHIHIHVHTHMCVRAAIYFTEQILEFCTKRHSTTTSL